jgi:hypothetical protein
MSGGYFISDQEMKEEIRKALDVERYHLFDTMSKALIAVDGEIKRMKEQIRILETQVKILKH